MTMKYTHVIYTYTYFKTISVNTEHNSDNTINICSVLHEIVLKIKIIVVSKHNSDNTINICLESNF